MLEIIKETQEHGMHMRNGNEPKRKKITTFYA